MKHTIDYFSFITEGKTQYHYTIVVDKKKFNVFDLLRDLKPLGAELLSQEPIKGNDDQVVILIAMEDSKKSAVEKKLAEYGEISNSNS